MHSVVRCLAVQGRIPPAVLYTLVPADIQECRLVLAPDILRRKNISYPIIYLYLFFPQRLTGSLVGDNHIQQPDRRKQAVDDMDFALDLTVDSFLPA